MINEPYVKQYNELGVLINPIVGKHETQFNNRTSRREVKQKHRFFGNGKNTPLVILKDFKYLKYRQLELNKEGKKKFIEHYVLIK